MNRKQAEALGRVIDEITAEIFGKFGNLDDREYLIVETIAKIILTKWSRKQEYYLN